MANSEAVLRTVSAAFAQSPRTAGSALAVMTPLAITASDARRDHGTRVFRAARGWSLAVTRTRRSANSGRNETAPDGGRPATPNSTAPRSTARTTDGVSMSLTSSVTPGRCAASA
jgi:hypothetical protein